MQRRQARTHFWLLPLRKHVNKLLASVAVRGHLQRACSGSEGTAERAWRGVGRGGGAWAAQRTGEHAPAQEGSGMSSVCRGRRTTWRPCSHLSGDTATNLLGSCWVAAPAIAMRSSTPGARMAHRRCARAGGTEIDGYDSSCAAGVPPAPGRGRGLGKEENGSWASWARSWQLAGG